MKLGRILFVNVHVLIQMLIKCEHVVLQVHRIVLEVILVFLFLIISKYFLSFRLFKIEFVPITAPLPSNSIQEQVIPTTITLPTNQNLSTSSTINICMMCKNNLNGTAHEDSQITTQTDFSDIKSLASRLIVGIHADEIEKKLLR